MKSDTILIEPHYIGNIEYYVLISNYPSVCLEVNDHFIKQTYRNRTTILTANGTQNLIVPVTFGNRTIYKDVKIDYQQKWVKDHMRAVKSAYAKSPFFEHFMAYFEGIWDRKYQFLHDLCLEMMTLCLDLLKIERKITETDVYFAETENSMIDKRNDISPKKMYDSRNNYRPSSYLQNFGNKFVPNLSVIDLLMCTGLASRTILQQSTIQREEQI